LASGLQALPKYLQAYLKDDPECAADLAYLDDSASVGDAAIAPAADSGAGPHEDAAPPTPEGEAVGGSEGPGVLAGDAGLEAQGVQGALLRRGSGDTSVSGEAASEEGGEAEGFPVLDEGQPSALEEEADPYGYDAAVAA
jgi:hypothetical protein